MKIGTDPVPTEVMLEEVARPGVTRFRAYQIEAGAMVRLTDMSRIAQ